MRGKNGDKSLRAHVAEAFEMTADGVFTRQFVEHRPGEWKGPWDPAPEGLRLESDDELRARFKGARGRDVWSIDDSSIGSTVTNDGLYTAGGEKPKP